MDISVIQQRFTSYAPVSMGVNLDDLDTNQKMVIRELIKAAAYADEIFWHQSAPDAIQTREQFKDQPGPVRAYIRINYGPDDLLQHIITYLAGLFRSMRFGTEEAHGLANLIQFNFLSQHNVILKNTRSGKYSIDPK